MAGFSTLFERNRRWFGQLRDGDPDYFNRLAAVQAPEYLWIGCADSRVPADQITGQRLGLIDNWRRHIQDVRDAWSRNQALAVHGWIYGLKDGLPHDLGFSAESEPAVESAYCRTL